MPLHTEEPPAELDGMKFFSCIFDGWKTHALMAAYVALALWGYHTGEVPYRDLLIAVGQAAGISGLREGQKKIIA